MKLYETPPKPQGFHLAGIIPAPKQSFEFNFQWPGHLTPVLEDGLSMAELAVYKCLYIGCDSVWFGSEKKGYKLTREKLGDFALSKTKYYHPVAESYKRKRVPIYYWHRANPNPKKYTTASMVCKLIEKSSKLVKNLSTHIIPDRYFVSFPGSIYDPGVLDKFRNDWTSSCLPKLLLRTPEKKTVQQGELLDFICQAEDYNKFDQILYEENTGFISQKMSRQSGKGLEEVIGKYIENDEVEYIDVDEYYAVEDWETYREYMGSEFECSLDRSLVDGEQVYRRMQYER